VRFGASLGELERVGASCGEKASYSELGQVRASSGE